MQGVSTWGELIARLFSWIQGLFTSSKPSDNQTVPAGAAEPRKFETGGFKYEDDQLFQAVSFSDRKIEKNMAVIHFSWTPSLESLSAYFSRQIPPNTANSTWGVGKDGTVHRYLPDVRFPSWTSNGVTPDGRFLPGQFIDPQGRWQAGAQYVNDNSTAFEVVNINYEDFTDEQYAAVARRILWMLDTFEDFRLWRVTGHEHLVPLVKDDPGAKWDWRRFFVSFVGMRPEFFDEYMKYLADTSYRTVGDASRSAAKFAQIKEAVDKIARDLSGKPKDFCL